MSAAVSAAPRLLAALVGGAAGALSLPPTGAWPLAAISIALLTLAVASCRVRAAFGYGFVFAAVLFAVALRWLAVVGADAWLALVVVTAVPVAVTAAVTALAMRLRWWPWTVGAVWVAQEAVRNRVPMGGWPWADTGFSQANAPWLPLAQYGGVPLLTFATASAGAWLAWAALNAARGGRKSPAAAALAVLAAPFALSLLPVAVQGQGGAGPSSAVVAVVQGNVPHTGLGFAADTTRRQVLDNHVTQTFALAEAVRQGSARQPDVVIWPENASDIDPLTAPDAAAAITAAARAVSAPILVGAVISNPADPTTLLNVGIVWDPVSGPTDRYAKQHPVPFGEYVPARPLLTRLIGRFELVPNDFVAGTSVGVLQAGPVRLGDIICFEVAYGDLVRDTVLAGGRMLAVQTNNATYTGAGQSAQQVAMARIRSVEHARSTVVAATNGISAIFTPDGGVIGELGESRAGSLVAELPLRDAITVADRIGWWPEVAAVMVAGVTAILGLRRPRSVWMWQQGGTSAASPKVGGSQHV